MNTTGKPYRISVVVPVYNEEGNVRELHEEIVRVCEKCDYTYEIIFVNDGSSDRTDEICRTLKPLKYVCLRKNYGQTAAMDAGIKAASYDYIVTMDGDLQNDPDDIPRLLEYLEEQHLDVVSGWRKNRKDTFGKRFVSRGANLLRGILVHDGIHDSGCSLKVYRRECFEGVDLYGEQHRFIPAILIIRGWKVGELEVHHRERTSGVTKYNWHRMFKGFVDMVSVWFWNKYASRPLHIMGTLGLFFLMLGGICGIWSIVLFAMGKNMSGYIAVPLLTVFFVIIGLLMFIFGLMSEALMKIYYGARIDRPYQIRDITVDGETIKDKAGTSNERETLLSDGKG